MHIHHGQTPLPLIDGSGYYVSAVPDRSFNPNNVLERYSYSGRLGIMLEIYDNNSIIYLLEHHGLEAAEEEFIGSDTNDTLESLLDLPEAVEVLEWFGEFGILNTAEAYNISPKALFNLYDFTHAELRGAVGYSTKRTELNDNVAQKLGLSNVDELNALLGYDS